jgi:Inner membrane protein YgaP-like, transmembrane domain
MSRQSAVHVLAGSLVLLSLALGWWVHPAWLLLAAFVGANLLQSGFTGFCPAEKIFGKCGLKDQPCQPMAKAEQ